MKHALRYRVSRYDVKLNGQAYLLPNFPFFILLPFPPPERKVRGVTFGREICLDVVRNVFRTVEVIGILFQEKVERLAGCRCKSVSPVAEARRNLNDKC